MMAFYTVQFLDGLSYAATLFLMAAGLSLIFGVTRIVNFAHGSFYMLGAYLAYSCAMLLMPKIGAAAGFWIGIGVAAVAVGVVGVLMEWLVLRRIYHAPELFQLLATFGVVLVVQDLVLAVWGREDLLAPRAPGFRGSVQILGERFPQYQLLLILLAPLVLGLLWLLFHRTRWGILVRAATEDREMTGALGVNQRALFTSVLFLGSALAGLGGALQIAKEAVTLQMDVQMIAETFVVVVVGGMGSILGAYLAAVLIGEVHAFGILIFPKITLVLVFAVMAAVLVVRPYGLLGRAETPPRLAIGRVPLLLVPNASLSRVWAVLVGLLALTVLPWVAGEYLTAIATEILIFTMFAASLHFILSIGGMSSFGHAAYFGLGAYGVALTTHSLHASMGLSLAAGVAAALAVALVFGWLSARLSGIYLAMLTLALAQILWSVAFQSDWTGGDNGILGVWPQGIPSSKRAYYLFVLVCASLSLWLLRRVIFSPFGYALRAGRDASLRSEAVGLDVARVRWMALGLAGGLAGLAGGLYAYHTGSVFPNVLGMTLSLDALLMVLLGGLHTLIGPLLGAAVYHALKTELVRLTEYWRLVLGLCIIVLVVAFPQGIGGFLRDTATRGLRRSQTSAPG
jgi:branched-chain amino acid transport system permease protein